MARPDVGSGEFMSICGSRALAGASSALVGIGQPNMAAMLAKRLHAPDLALVYESGVVDSNPEELPLSICDPTLVKGAASVCSMVDLFAYYVAAGRIEVGFVGGAQVDRSGRINATVIGPYDAPMVRLPGRGGASDIALSVSRLVVMTRHEARRLVEEVDFVTAEPPPGGEQVVVTDLAIFKPRDGELVVDSIHPGVEADEVRARTGWDVVVPDDVRVTKEASSEEIDALRSLDPEGLYSLGGD